MLSADPAVAAQVTRSAPCQDALAQASVEDPDLSQGPSPRASGLTMILMAREDPPASQCSAELRELLEALPPCTSMRREDTSVP